MYPTRRKAFTLIELLIVIAIIAILSVVVILILNPAELLRQSRDGNRVTDMDTLNHALGLYSTDQSGAPSFFLGSVSTTFVSIPDPLVTSTAGDQCQGLGLPSLPTGYVYHCVSAASLRLTNGSGWIPVNLSGISSGSPLNDLPIDPVNASSSDLYYTYTTDGSRYKLTAFMESQRYAQLMVNDGGTDGALLESGSDLNMISPGRGLVGYWPLDEGNGSTALDESGNGNNSSWIGTPAGLGGSYYTGGKVGNFAGYFDGGTDSTNASIALPMEFSTYMAWFKPQTVAAQSILVGTGAYISNLLAINPDATLGFCSDGGGNITSSNGSITPGTWNFAAVVLDGAGDKSLYLNGVLVGSAGTYTYAIPTLLSFRLASTTGGAGLCTSNYGTFEGAIDDVHIYTRALSASEIQEIYNAEK